MVRTTTVAVIVTLLLVAVALISCGGTAAAGTLQFLANGEDFVREGFVSKDGWSITFDHVYVHLAEVTAYQTDPPYDPHTSATIEGDVEASLPSAYTVDLAEGDESADPILVGEVENAAVGLYNAVSWKMTKASSGPAEGYALVVVGTAEKDGHTIDFTISIEEEYTYCCGEYVGDERKGIVEGGDTADVEMTFHFDHVFGDFDAPADDHVNTGATGFDPFAALADNGVVDEDLASLEAKLSLQDYQTLVNTLPTLGHVGEGHCYCDKQPES
ncbi:MAG: DUF4382 domain-containing protein [Chloroflexota bacterium]|nr:DUF4382 domain-containing protein [Chloroflexota bacterium]